MVIRSFKAQTTIKQLRLLKKLFELSKSAKEKNFLSIIGQGNELRNFAKMVVAEGIG